MDFSLYGYWEPLSLSYRFAAGGLAVLIGMPGVLVLAHGWGGVAGRPFQLLRRPTPVPIFRVAAEIIFGALATLVGAYLLVLASGWTGGDGFW